MQILNTISMGQTPPPYSYSKVPFREWGPIPKMEDPTDSPQITPWRSIFLWWGHGGRFHGKGSPGGGG